MNTLHKYTTLNEILEAALSDYVGDIFKTSLGQRVYFDLNGNCTTGKLLGLGEDGIEQYYIVEKDGKELLIPSWQSLTKL